MCRYLKIRSYEHDVALLIDNVAEGIPGFLANTTGMLQLLRTNKPSSGNDALSEGVKLNSGELTWSCLHFSQKLIPDCTPDVDLNSMVTDARQATLSFWRVS